MQNPYTPQPRDYSRKSNARKFLDALDAKILFHQTNTNDPHGIGNGVMISLLETRNAYAEAFGFPPAPSQPGKE